MNSPQNLPYLNSSLNAINRKNSTVNKSNGSGNSALFGGTESAALAYRKRKYRKRGTAKPSISSNSSSMVLSESAEPAALHADNEFSDEDDGRLSATSVDGLTDRRSNSPSNDELRRNRQHHNELERKRRDHIKIHFNILKNVIPLLEGEKSSRALILKRAVDYIKMLQIEVQETMQEIEQIKRHNDVLSQATSLLSSSQQIYGAAAAVAAATVNSSSVAENASTAQTLSLPMNRQCGSGGASANGNVVNSSAFTLPVNAPHAFNSSITATKPIQLSASLPHTSVFPSTSTSPTASIESSPKFSPIVACTPMSLLLSTDFKHKSKSNEISSSIYGGCGIDNPTGNCLVDASPKQLTNSAPNVTELLNLLISQNSQNQQQQRIVSQTQQPIQLMDQQHFYSQQQPRPQLQHQQSQQQHQLQLSKDLAEISKNFLLQRQQQQLPFIVSMSTVPSFCTANNSFCNNNSSLFNIIHSNNILNISTANNNASGTIAVATDEWTD